MNTRARLDSVLQMAFPVPFDDNSKFVFFGDVKQVIEIYNSQLSKK
jgi:hypothetical protein